MLSAPIPATGSLELKAEKQSAHSDAIYSVAFNNDGTKIVSGSDDKTIKVWDAGTYQCFPTCSPPHMCTLVHTSEQTHALSARRSSPARTTRRSKCGTQVSRFSFCHDASLALTTIVSPQIPSR